MFDGYRWPETSQAVQVEGNCNRNLTESAREGHAATPLQHRSLLCVPAQGITVHDQQVVQS